jgi:hypothetical protein
MNRIQKQKENKNANAAAIHGILSMIWLTLLLHFIYIDFFKG